jgi:outer membrane receptor protein involved in Fe transport
MADKVRKLFGASLGALTASLAMSGAATITFSTSALAQTATAGIAGVASPDAEIVARNVDTGFTGRDVADSGGGYTIRGLQPGTYEVTAAGGTPQRIRVLVGQTATLDFVDDAGGEIVVVATRTGVDITSSEVSTSVTDEQIRNLPQTTRNFINFAALAPGVAVSSSDQEVTFGSSGEPARTVNVFIDGQSQKAQIIDGGVAGQDDSRGNPFPQLAVQEFRVLTQNFSAQYDQASSAIITAVTRSGTNEFHGEVFGVYQDESWIHYRDMEGFDPPSHPEAERQQFGGALGGPIIQDRLHFFASYEGKRDTRFGVVTLGQPGFEAMFPGVEGVVDTPFEEDLWFGKLSWQPNNFHNFDLSYTGRTEQDVRSVGGQETADRANILAIDETKVNFRHQWDGSGWFNQAQVDWLESNYNPRAANFDDPGQEFVVFRDADTGDPDFDFDPNVRQGTVIVLGGRGDNQDIRQRSLTVRDDLTFDEINGHTIQVGGRVTFNNYFVEKLFGGNPQFLYDAQGRPEINGDPNIPVRVNVSSPTPAADVDNTVYGVYIQDDWQVNDRLELNLGLRWDYEDNAFNNDYTTPDNIVAALEALEAVPGAISFNPDDYIANGDREAFAEAFQPRLGFSYDLSGDETLVLFGGAGRYYDRVPYNFAFDELYKPNAFGVTINFSEDGAPGTTLWDPIYLTPEGLQPLIDAATGSGELFLVQNGAEPPVTDQFNLGIRHVVEDWRLSATLSHSESRNGFSWAIGNRGTNCCNGVTPSSVGFPEYRNIVFISNHDQERDYNALFLTADKPFDEESGWGLGVTYTYSTASKNGSRDENTAPFDFDYATPADSPEYPSGSDERHRLVISGIVQLPYDFRLSALATFSTGKNFTIFGAGPPLWNAGTPYAEDMFFFGDVFANQNIDLRLSKDIDFSSGHSAYFYVDLLNATDHVNPTEGTVEQCVCSPLYSRITPRTSQGRSYQIGFGYRF